MTMPDNIIPFARGYPGKVHWPIDVDVPWTQSRNPAPHPVAAACGARAKRGWQMTFMPVDCKHCLKVVSKTVAAAKGRCFICGAGPSSHSTTTHSFSETRAEAGMHRYL